MTLLRRPAPRFVLWSVVLVLIATGAGYLGLSWWLIVAAEFLTWILIAMAERSLAGVWTTHPAPFSSAPAVFETIPTLAQPEPELEPPPAAEPPPVPAAQEPAPPPEPPEPPEPEPDPEPEPPPPEVAAEPPPRAELPPEPAPPTPPLLPPMRASNYAGPVQWNVWTLERLAHEKAADNDELMYLIVYLRDFADAKGLLPVGFDALVRESFGELLPSLG